LHRLAGARVFHAGIALRQQRLAQHALADAHLREKAGHAVVIRLAPAVERVVVALRARDAHAEKYLRHRVSHLAGLAHDLVEMAGRCLVEGPFGGEQRTRELVERPVCGKLPANPPVINVGVARAELLPIYAQQVGPLQRPEVRELRPFQQRAHELRALVGGLVIEKAPRLVRRGERADDVEVRAAQKGRIIAHIAGP